MDVDARLTDATATQSRAYCAQHNLLFAQIAAATRAEQIHTRLNRLSDQIRATTSGVTETPPAAAAQLMAGLLGWRLDRVLGLQAAILPIVLELASAAMPGLAYWSLMRAQRSDRPAHGEAPARVPEPVGQAASQPTKKRAKKSTRPSSTTGRTGQFASRASVTPLRPRKSGDSEQLGRSVSGATTERFSGQKPSSSAGPQTPGSDGSAARAIRLVEPLGQTAQDDPVAAFASDQVVADRAGLLPAADLLSAIKAWCTQRGLAPVNRTQLGREMGRLGYRKRRAGANGNIVYIGTRLREAGS